MTFNSTSTNPANEEVEEFVEITETGRREAPTTFVIRIKDEAMEVEDTETIATSVETQIEMEDLVRSYGRLQKEEC